MTRNKTETCVLFLALHQEEDNGKLDNSNLGGGGGGGLTAVTKALLFSTFSILNCISEDYSCCFFLIKLNQKREDTMGIVLILQQTLTTSSIMPEYQRLSSPSTS